MGSLMNMLDELDTKLIKELQKSGRQGYVALAKLLGVVEGTVRKRVKNRLFRSFALCVKILPGQGNTS